MDARSEGSPQDALAKLPTGWSMKGASDAEWDAIFERLLGFMSNDDRTNDDRRPHVSDLAAERLGHAVSDEASYRYDFTWPRVSAARSRLAPIFAAIEARERRVGGAIEAFSYGLGNLHDIHRLPTVLILEWLQSLQERGLNTPGRLVAEIRLWPWGDGPSRGRTPLIQFLQHSDRLVRAVAANELGKTMEDIEPEFASEWSQVAPILDAVRSAELDRPGVAGAFIWGLPRQLRDDPRLDEWVFALVTSVTAEEPEVPYFNTLEWVATEEVLTRDARWIPALVEAGRDDLANWVALATDLRTPEVRRHLAQMTTVPDDWTAQAAAMLLATRFRHTTRQATGRGFVAVLRNHRAFHAFVVFDHDDAVHPRIVALYPARSRRTLSVEEADNAVDVVVSPRLRGREMLSRRSTDSTPRREFRREVYVTYELTGKKDTLVRRIEIVGNGIQGPRWNPVARIRRLSSSDA